MKSIAVFCGSSLGADDIYKEHAILVGKKLASQNIQLIYGGAKIGLMGVVADTVLEIGGSVIGVIPEFLKTKEVVHEHLNELITTETMSERKSIMFEMSDAIITLPGGFGTLEELGEVLTLAQLGLYNKPMGIFNINGFYEPLIEMLDKMVEAGFLKQANKDMLLVSNDLEDLFKQIENYQAIEVKKWIS